MADVKLPLVGNVNKKALGISAAAAVGVLVVLYVRKSRSAAAANAASSAPAASDTSADDIDPATGFPYGSAQDTEALATQQGGGGLGYSGLDTTDIDPLTGYTYGSPQDEAGLATEGYGGTTTTTGTTVSTAPTTNSDWEQEAIQNLEAGGVDATTISNAESGLPRYLAKLPLSSAQATAVQLAVGLTGEPPTGGPFSIIPQPATATTGTGTTTGTTPAATQVTVPNVMGDSVNSGEAKLTAAGLVPNVNSGGPRDPKNEYVIWSQTPGPGKKAAKGSKIDLAIKVSKVG